MGYAYFFIIHITHTLHTYPQSLELLILENRTVYFCVLCYSRKYTLATKNKKFNETMFNINGENTKMYYVSLHYIG